MASLSSLQGITFFSLPPKASKTLASTTAVASSPTTRNGAAWNPLSSIRCKSIRSVSALASSSTDDPRPELDDNPEGIISGEWPENISLLSYDDLRAYLETQIIHKKIKPTALLEEVMSTQIWTATADQTLEEIDHHFQLVSGLPVIDADLKCIGVISKKDKARASRGLKSRVGEVMSSPAITLSPDKTVLEAAALMLKMKIHRIPILNEKQQVVGIVTRTDIFRALETQVELYGAFMVRFKGFQLSKSCSKTNCGAKPGVGFIMGLVLTALIQVILVISKRYDT